ncbi:MAG: PDZ domain-containing protein, partial [Anaerolineales bacterium]
MTKAGLQRGDVIIELDGQEVTNAARLKYLIAYLDLIRMNTEG